MAGYQTVSDIYERVLEGINKTKSSSLSPDEFESLANECQMKLVKNLYSTIELVQKNIDDASSLVKEPILLIPTATNTFDLENAGVSAGGKLYDPSVSNGRYGHLFTLKVHVQWNYLDNKCFKDGVVEPDRFVECKPWKTDKSLEKDYYNRPTDERPYYWMHSTGTSQKVMKIINNRPSFAHRALLYYVAYPRLIDLNNTSPTDIDLNISVREDLVRMMISTYLERMESRRWQSVQVTESKNY